MNKLGAIFPKSEASDISNYWEERIDCKKNCKQNLVTTVYAYCVMFIRVTLN